MKKIILLISSLYSLYALTPDENPVNCLPFDSNGNINYECVSIAPLPFTPYTILSGDFPTLYPYISIKTTNSVDKNNELAISYEIIFISDVTLSVHAQPSHGAITIKDSTIIYTPNKNYYGEDNFSIDFADDEKGVFQKDISITVINVNNIPQITINTTLATNEESNVTQNFTVYDADNDNLIIIILSEPLNGSVEIAESNFTYTPKPNFYGTDIFALRFDDGAEGIVDKNITVNVTNINDAPTIAINTSLATHEETEVKTTFTFDDVDADDVVATLSSNPSHGKVAISGENISYTPNTDFVGEDSFGLNFSDGKTTIGKTISITVSNINDFPKISIQSEYSTFENNSLDMNYSYTDVDGDAISVTLEANSTHGSVKIIDNKITYTPNTDYLGSDTFSLLFSDGNDGNISKTVQVLTVIKDSDGDGVKDSEDAFVNDIAASVDIDGDGKPEIWNDGYDEQDSTTGLRFDEFGNLIILTGDSDNPTDPLYNATQKLSQTFYERFKTKGFGDDEIFWINQNSLSGVDEYKISTNSFYDAIGNWATNYDTNGILYIYMVDHGANGSFKISGNDIDGDGQKEIVYASKFLNVIEQFIEATHREVVIIMEACNSGSFIPYFEKSKFFDNYISIITSSEANKNSFIDMFGKISFTKLFVDELLKGFAIEQSFENAKLNLKSKGGVYINQIPLISMKANALKNTKLGNIFNIANTQFLEVGAVVVNNGVSTLDLISSKEISIKVPITGDSKNKVWATVVPPNFSVSNLDAFETPNLEPYTIELNLKNANIYEAIYDLNTQQAYSGNYDITVFAEDINGFVYSQSVSIYANGELEYNEVNETNLILYQGWNLVALPINTTISYDELNATFPTAYTIWKYENNKWQVYIKEDIKVSLDKITSISKEQGFWVNSTSDANVSLSGKSYETSVETLSSGWHLLGAGNEMNVSNLENNNIQVIWTYENSWRAYSPNTNIMSLITQSGITPLESIKQAQGFWVNVK